MYEMKKGGRYGIGFIDPNTINEYTWNLDTYYRASVEESMLEFHTVLYYKFGFCLLASYMFLLTYICPLN